MEDKQVEFLASDVFERLGAARKALLAEMHALGLTTEKGWRIIEELPNCTTRTVSPYFSPNMATAPAFLASAIGISRVV